MHNQFVMFVEVLTTEADGKERSIQFTGLDPSRQYRVSVRALTLSNISSVDSKFITGHPYAESKFWYYSCKTEMMKKDKVQ